MTFAAIVTITILVATLIILATQRLRADLTALLVTLSLILTNVLSPEEAFAAFGQPVIIIIASVYIIGGALYETGVAAIIANQLLRFSSRGKFTLTLVIMLTAALLSSVLSGLLVIAVLLPAVLRMARQARLAPSQLLLPLAAAAVMGNLLTLIGAVSNVVIGDILVANGQPPLDFFTLTPYGLALLLVAMAWYLFIGRHLLRQETVEDSQRPSLSEIEHSYDLENYLYQLRVRTGSNLVSRRLDESKLGPRFRLNIVAIRPQSDPLMPPKAEWTLERDDLLIVEGDLGDVLQAASLHHLEYKGKLPLDQFNELEQETLRLAEVMIPFRSPLVGKTATDIQFRERYGLNILAIHRRGKAVRENLPHLTLATGDTMLVQGAIGKLRRISQDPTLVLATYLGPERGELITGKVSLTLVILGVMVLCVVLELLALATATLAAAVALILTGCLSIERAYKSVDANLLVLIGGMLPLATALQKTGVAELIANLIAGLSGNIGVTGSLLLLYGITAVLTQIISNTVTATLILPVAINLALAQGVSPHPFAIAIAVAVMAAFVTPLTSGSNLMIREPGQYKMRDYLVNGVPIFLLQTVVLFLMLRLL